MVLPLALLLQLTCRRYLLVPMILLYATTVVVLVRGGGALGQMGPVGVAVLLGVFAASPFGRAPPRDDGVPIRGHFLSQVSTPARI